jgi:hypothetical protein
MSCIGLSQSGVQTLHCRQEVERVTGTGPLTLPQRQGRSDQRAEDQQKCFHTLSPLQVHSFELAARLKIVATGERRC